MSAIHAADSSKSIGLGRPSSLGDDQRPQTLTTSLSLSSSSSASSLNSLSPLPLARSQYSSAAHHFIQRRPQQALGDLEEARRLAFQVISPADEVRRNASWVGLREKVVILWMTLLVSFAKDGSTGGADEVQMSQETQELLQSATRPDVFLGKLVSGVLIAWASSSDEHETLKSGNEQPSSTRQKVLGSLPASVTASLIMAGLSIEEAAATEKPSTSSRDAEPQQHQQASPSAVPLTRDLAEELLSAQSAQLDQTGDVAGAPARDAVLAAYARVLELYGIHVLGVRCGQWDYADQLVRLSLLQDEPRAKLLVALQKAHTHISTRPERRASAALAQQKAYEAEKQRRASATAQEAKARVDKEGVEEREAKKDGARPRPVRRTSSSSNNATSESETESSAPKSQTRKREGMTSSNSNNNDFAATRAHLSNTISKHHQRDAGEATTARPPAAKPHSAASSSSQQSMLRLLQTYLRTLRIPAVLSILAPLLVIIFSVRRLTAGTRRGAQRRTATNGAPAPPDAGLLRRAIASVWGTLRMGTQVTYL